MVAALTRHIGPLPVWAYGAIVIIGGVVFYLWWRHYTNSSSTNAANAAQSQASTLNPTNDPNIDPNTGVPYQLEEAIDPNTGMPYYYSNYGNPGTPSAPPTPNPVANPPIIKEPSPPKVTPIATPPHIRAQPPKSGTGSPPIIRQRPPQFEPDTRVHPLPPVAIGGGPGSGTTYTFQAIGQSGQTAPLSHVASEQYGVRGTQATVDATQAIINANPALRGKSHHYQPPVGTTIVLP